MRLFSFEKYLFTELIFLNKLHKSFTGIYLIIYLFILNIFNLRRVKRQAYSTNVRLDSGEEEKNS